MMYTCVFQHVETTYSISDVQQFEEVGCVIFAEVDLLEVEFHARVVQVRLAWRDSKRGSLTLEAPGDQWE